ncbi:glycosyl hydrolase family 16 [uncultured Flavobacterium sp.]|uniref:glycosyl hydrolase family 16 n=1 Tax=uncultured Flavobacterium sp. TaxID=165435 RepID=UPI0030ECAB4C|tara:strand:- start:84411 stop:85814 length:1404 start_codon:yes stop_codon:yes gene_type:complete
MKGKKYNYFRHSLIIGFVLLININCDRDLSDDAVQTGFSSAAEIFIDGFSSGLEYYPYENSKLDAFTVDSQTKYSGSSSMRFDVPNFGDAEGAFAGAIFRDDNGGRDLTQYNALTFWAKGTKAGKINEIGYGQDFGENKYEVSIQNLHLTTNWKKYIIPIPDASKLTQERGMFWYAEGPEDENGYTFWIDELKFEKLGTISQGQVSILNGNNQTETSYVGVNSLIDGVTATYNLANGNNQTISISPSYLQFNSSNTAVATVDSSGSVTSLSTGTALINATFGGASVTGSLTINCAGAFVHAPTPTKSQANVISLFSDAYSNVPVNYYNGYWQPWQTTVSNDFSVQGDNILNYTIFNFVGIEYSSPTVDASAMTHVHLDVFIPGSIAPGRQLRVLVVDFGADGVFGGGDDTRHSTTFTAPTLVSQNWISIDIPFSAMPTLASRSHLAQLILEGGDGSLIYVDNIYYYN